MSLPKLSKTGVFDFFVVLASEVGMNGFSLLPLSLSFSSGKEEEEGRSSKVAESFASINLNCSLTIS